MIKKILPLFLLPLILTGCGAEQVDTGEVGIKVTFGAVNGEPLTEGLYFYNPFTSSIKTLSYRTNKLSEQTEAYTKDIQQATVSYVVNYNLDKTHALDVFKEFGDDWEEKIIPQIITSSIKNTTGKWVAIDAISNRESITKQISEEVTSKLKAKYVSVTGFVITDISFSKQFENAVEAKVVASQLAEKSKNETVTIEEQAKQRVIGAQADAEAMRIKTEALKNNQALVLYDAVQKWDGKLPQYMLSDTTGLLMSIQPQQK